MLALLALLLVGIIYSEIIHTCTYISILHITSFYSKLYPTKSEQAHVTATTYNTSPQESGSPRQQYNNLA